MHEQLQNFYPDDEIKSFVYLILESTCSLDRTSILRGKDKQLSANEHLLIQKIIEKLKKYNPIQYILGETEFYGLKLKVNENVLIPRPETEELVERVIESERQQINDGRCKLLDIGTGSGCIAVALAKHLPDADVYALDISEKALEVARQNATMNRVKVRFFQQDILAENPLPAALRPLLFDFIVSNPPYITPKEKTTMAKNVLDYEPHQALFVPQERPLLFYEQMAVIGRRYLKENGSLYFEINSLYGEMTRKMLEEKKYQPVKLLKDISGNDRIIIAQL
jgi:release factor glutamine methyltransferase